MQGQLRQAGVNTGNLAGEQRRLAGALDGASTAFGRQMDRMRRLEVMQKRIADERERMDRSLATSANLSFVGGASMQTGRRILTGLSGPVKQAVEFETAMSDVRKVVDFESPDGFRQMSDDILTLSTRIPMAAEGLAQIVASGGQSGLANNELLQFAEMAAKIGVAFDISAEQSGDSMANIKTALGLTLDETGLLFDAMNHLSNNMASTAPKVLNFTNRVAVDGAVKGFSPTETMAFGSAMIAAGAQSDVAATSFRNMGKALARGDGATKRQSAAFRQLGLDAGEVARSMQEDAVGTTIDVMQRINELPKHLQASVTSDLFGDEARALAPLINNLDLLREALGLVSDERKYQGSAEKEYAARAETTANNLQLMRNQLVRLGVTIGSVVLPPLNDLLEMSQGVVDRMVTWAKEHPKLTKWLAIGGAAIGGMAVAAGALLTAAAGLIGTMAVLRFGLVGLGARAIFARGEVASLVMGIAYAGRSGSGLAKIGTSLSAFTSGRAGAIRLVGAGLRGIAGVTGLRLVATGLTALVGVVGAISAPIWGGIAVVVAAVGVAWKYWDRISSIARGVASAIGERLRPVLEGIRPVLEFLAPAVDGVKTAFSGVGSVIGDVVSAIRNFFSGDLFFREILTDEEQARLETSAAEMTGKIIDGIASGISGIFQVGRDIIISLWDGVRAEFNEFIGWVKDIPASIVEAIGSVDLSNIIDWPDPPAWWTYLFGGEEGAVPAAGGVSAGQVGLQRRASGGPFGTKPLLVGERGPELYFPNRAGFIANHHQLQRMHSAAQVVRAASLSVLTISALAGPTAVQAGQSGKKGGDVRVEINGGINIQVPAGVTDPEAIADLVSDRIGQRVAATMSASFSD
ncbi:phage tail tape measure protein [Thalassovita aquimarina]|uniref:Phage tail tape measure protein n=1 Tax=Thalassovita aquimarina TaxID=2785917 RepID=A0ABS5HSI8_9RHOB|nr:phage tail tape measure protein [Thalassovita aquimarina]MBR9651927.1 phage tail tape measure protein [Thalassovita aquimarina]